MSKKEFYKTLRDPMFKAIFCDERELEKYCEGDEIMQKFKSEVKRLNNDSKFFQLMSDEKEEQMAMNTIKAEMRLEGLAEGRAEGQKETTLLIASNMLKQNMKIDLIVKVTGLSEKEIKELM